MRGVDPLKFIPLHLGDLVRLLELVGWNRSWWGPVLETFNPEGCIARGHVQGSHLWEPAPEATETDMGFMMDSNIKRPYASHVMVFPRLMTYLWRK